VFGAVCLGWWWLLCLLLTRSASLLTRLLREVDRVIVCDDGSVDLTGEIAEAMGAVVVRHGRNMDDVYIYRSTILLCGGGA